MRHVHWLNALYVLDETTHYGLLKSLKENSGLSQRDLSKRLRAEIEELQ